MDECLFCNIVENKKEQFVFEDDQVVAFPDINPKAPIHILIVPKHHLESVAAMAEGDEKIVGHMVRTAKQIAETQGISDTGYRLVLNTRNHGGQTVDHIHLHLIGGQKLGGMV